MPPRQRGKSQSLSGDTAVAVMTPHSSASPQPAAPASPKPARKGKGGGLHSRSSSTTLTTSPNTSLTTTKRKSSPSSKRSPTHVSAGASHAASKPAVAQSVPPSLRFPLAVVLNLALSALLFSLTAGFTAEDLAPVSKQLQSWPEVTGVIFWRVAQLSAYWVAGLDAYETSALSLLVNLPSQIFLFLFYSIRPTTILVSLAVNVVSMTVPFSLLRRLRPIHSSDPTLQRFIPRLTRTIISDPITTISTTLLATAIFAVTLEASFVTWFPNFVITRYEGLGTLEPAYRAPVDFIRLLFWLLPAGFAAREFVFVSSTASAAAWKDKLYKFDPVAASLKETLWHNAWGWYSSREKALIQRTVLAVVLIGVETSVQSWATIKGVSVDGAAGYAALWAAAMSVVGLVFGWVGGPGS